jgi:hypothetical protein
MGDRNKTRSMSTRSSNGPQSVIASGNASGGSNGLERVYESGQMMRLQKMQKDLDETLARVNRLKLDTQSPAPQAPKMDTGSSLIAPAAVIDTGMPSRRPSERPSQEEEEEEGTRKTARTARKVTFDFDVDTVKDYLYIKLREYILQIQSIEDKKTWLLWAHENLFEIAATHLWESWSHWQTEMIKSNKAMAEISKTVNGNIRMVWANNDLVYEDGAVPIDILQQYETPSPDENPMYRKVVDRYLEVERKVMNVRADYIDLNEKNDLQKDYISGMISNEQINEKLMTTIRDYVQMHQEDIFGVMYNVANIKGGFFDHQYSTLFMEYEEMFTKENGVNALFARLAQIEITLSKLASGFSAAGATYAQFTELHAKTAELNVEKLEKESSKFDMVTRLRDLVSKMYYLSNIMGKNGEKVPISKIKREFYERQMRSWDPETKSTHMALRKKILKYFLPPLDPHPVQAEDGGDGGAAVQT